MIRKCILETNGYRIAFNLKNIQKTQTDFVDSIVEFQLNSHLGELLARSIPTFIHFKDLQRLVTYLKQHIAILTKDPNSESHTFATYGLGFQIQALSGHVSPEGEGLFTIRFMVNVGQAHEKACSIYVGGESVVTFANIRSFTASLQDTLSDFSYSK